MSKPPGPSVDAAGQPVGDPSPNVLDLVGAAIQRQDDLRVHDSAHVREIIELRAEFARELRMAEAARIDAIRAVDVGAVQQAASVSASQAHTLATQVATSAETLRNQVAAAATAAAVSLAAALEPIIKDIADLRRAQYEAQGVKATTSESRDVRRDEHDDRRGGTMVVIAAVSVLIAFVSLAAVVLIAVLPATPG